jgi:hypothetical protein
MDTWLLLAVDEITASSGPLYGATPNIPRHLAKCDEQMWPNPVEASGRRYGVAVADRVESERWQVANKRTIHWQGPLRLPRCDNVIMGLRREQFGKHTCMIGRILACPFAGSVSAC